MGKTIKKKYDRYTLSFKLKAIKLADHPGISAIEVAESLFSTKQVPRKWFGLSALLGMNVNSPKCSSS